MASKRRDQQLTLFNSPGPSPPAIIPAVPEPQAFYCFESSLVALGLLKGVGQVTAKALVDAFDGDLRRLWDADQTSIEGILTKARTPSAAAIAKSIAENGSEIWDGGKRTLGEMEARGVQVVQRNKVPDRLKALSDDPPRWLFVEGAVDCLKPGLFVAVVGTRNPTPEGLEATRRICRVLARYPSITVVSGLAEGIDAEAHETSLSYGLKNLAFLGHGINHVFPASTAGTRKRIVEAGGVVATEYLPNEKFQKAFFVRRNRLQAGLADLVIPVQADSKSGTAHTLNFAKAYEKAVVGVRWPEATGVVDDIAAAGYPVFDIFEESGVRRLDAVLRRVVEEAGQKVYAFAQTEKLFLREVKTRQIRAEDLSRLMRAIESAYEEVRAECPSPESSSITPSSSDKTAPPPSS